MGFLDRFKAARDDEKTALTSTSGHAPFGTAEHEIIPAPTPNLVPVAELSPVEMTTEVPISVVSAPAAGETFGDFAVAPEAVAPENAPVVISAPESAPETAPEPAPFIDFENEFAALVPPAISMATPAPISPAISPARVLDEAELEEWSEPLPSAAPEILGAGARLESPQGLLTIEAHLETRGGENVYRAAFLGAGETEPQIVRLREAGGAWGERLAREAMWRTHWDATARIAMLPRLICSFKDGETAYLGTEMPGEGPTLSQSFALEEGQSVEQRADNQAAF